MYGEKGLPGNPTSRFGIHPAWWQPDATGIETRVSIEFQADGSSRHHTTTDNDTFLYRLDRTVKTIGLNTSKDDEPGLPPHRRTRLAHGQRTGRNLGAA